MLLIFQNQQPSINRKINKFFLETQVYIKVAECVYYTQHASFKKHQCSLLLIRLARSTIVLKTKTE